MTTEDLKELLGLAQKQLSNANKLLQTLKSTTLTQPNENVEAGLEAIQTYIIHAEEIINWIK